MRAIHKYLLLLFCLLPVASPAVQAARCACVHHHCPSHEAAGVHEACCEAGGHGQAALTPLYVQERADAPQTDTLVALPVYVQHVCRTEQCCGRVYLAPACVQTVDFESPTDGRAPPFFIRLS